MQDVLQWGVELIRAIQTIESPALTAVMKALTFTGSEYFYLLALPVVFWAVDEKLGARLGVVFMMSTFVNAWLKVVFAQPRPFNLDPSVGLAHETSYGLPSGHAQGVSSFWGLLAPAIARPWGMILAIGLPLLIGFTRLYLGVHFPTDVLLGLALGWGFAFAGTVLSDRVVALFMRWRRIWRIVLVATVSIVMNALLPEDTSASGVFLGTAVGAIFMFEKVRFEARSGTIARKAVRLLLGLAGLAVLYVGVKMIAPGEGEANYALFRFVRYGLLGAWVSFGAPWVFVKTGLAGVSEANPSLSGSVRSGSAHREV